MNIVVNEQGKIFIRSRQPIEILRKHWPNYLIFEDMDLPLPDDRYIIRRRDDIDILPVPIYEQAPETPIEDLADGVLQEAKRIAAENAAVFAELDDNNWNTLTPQDVDALHLYCRALADIRIFKGYTDTTKTTVATLPSVPEILQ